LPKIVWWTISDWTSSSEQRETDHDQRAMPDELPAVVGEERLAARRRPSQSTSEPMKAKKNDFGDRDRRRQQRHDDQPRQHRPRIVDKSNLNIRAATLHVAGDLLGSIAAVTASTVILTTGWMPIDPLLSVLVALIILRSAWRVVAASGHILLEGSPPGFDVRAFKDEIRAALPFVLDIHHVHAWSISQERPMVTLHASVAEGTDSVTAVRRIKHMLAEHFLITHATIEIEYDACGDDHGHPHGDGHDDRGTDAHRRAACED
jgi:cation diffusion facilitator family transporter